MKYPPEIISQVAAMASGYAVIYLEGQPYPLTAAGNAGDGRLFYMEGQKPHFVPEGMLTIVETNSVAFYQGDALEFYFTPAVECFEIPLSDIISTIKSTREAMGPDEIAATIRQLEPHAFSHRGHLATTRKRIRTDAE